MDIRIEITGTTPLLCHNVALVDPDNPVVTEIATYTAKRKKTEDDRRAIERLEWYGGLYLEDGQPVLPTKNIKKCLVETAKVTRHGKDVSRATSFTTMTVPIAHDGPTAIDDLFADKNFTHRAAVGIGAKRTMRVRPQFPRWALVAELKLLEAVMDLDVFTSIIQLAGSVEGLGDNRINGFGRFEAKVIA